MEDDVKWITVNHTHIPIKDGQTVEEAMAEHFDEQPVYEIKTTNGWEVVDKDEYEDALSMGVDTRINADKSEEEQRDPDKIYEVNLNGKWFTVPFGVYKRYKAEGKETRTSHEDEYVPDYLRQYIRLSKPATVDEATTTTNPNYRIGGYEWTYNCQRCVVAYVMRRLGYDVKAKPYLGDNVDTIFDVGTAWWETFEGFKWEPGKNIYDHYDSSGRLYTPGSEYKKAITKQLEEDGDGAIRIIHCEWHPHRGQKQGDSHVFIGENVGGKIRFVDPQSGNVKYNPWGYICYKADNHYYCFSCRVDNKKITKNVELCVWNND